MSPIFVPVEVVDPEEPPTEQPPVLVHPVYNHGFTLIGGDGSTWDLVGGPVYILAGASGFGFPEPEHRWKESSNADGAIHGGLKYGIRDFSLPLEVDGRYRTPGDWRDLERRFWQAVNPRRECRLKVSAPDGDFRTMSFRYASGGDEGFELDPLRREDNVYPLDAVAGLPFWIGNHVIREYVIAESLPTFPGPPFYLGSSTAIQDTVVPNDGDEDAWPRWVITGPYTDVTIGIDGAQVVLGTPIQAGETRVIVTDPAQGRSIRREDGSLAWSEATTLDEFAPIPAGGDSVVVMSMSGGLEGTSGISLEFDERYLRAFP